MGFISRIRQKPEDVRRKYTAVLSVAITLIIVFIWLSVSTNLFRGSDAPEVKKEEEKHFTETPFESLVAGTRAAGLFLQDQIAELIEKF